MIKLKAFFSWFALFLAILTGIIMVTINSVWLYWLNLKTSSVLSMVGLSMHEMLVNYGDLLAYLQLPWLNDLVMPDFTDSVSGLKHFAEVKQLVVLNHLVFLVTIIPAVRFVHSVRHEQQQWRFVRPFSIGALIPLLLGLLMAIDFNHFFVLFHEMLFRNSDWLFDPLLDPIIIALPEAFFAQCFALAVGLFEGVMLFGVWRGKVALKRL